MVPPLARGLPLVKVAVAPACQSGGTIMSRTFLSAALVLMALVAPASAAERASREPVAPTASKDATLQLFKDVQKQVLGYPQFSIFDSVHIAIDNGAVE